MFKWNDVSVNKKTFLFKPSMDCVCAVCDLLRLVGYFLRFFNGGKPLSNSDVDKLIDLATNLPSPVVAVIVAGRFIPLFFTVFESVTRSDFFVVDLKSSQKEQTGNWNTLSC